MPYSKEYNEEKYQEIEKYIGQLALLEKGKVLLIAASSLEEAEHLRWLFYDYFNLTSTKESFKTTLFNNLLLVGKVKPSLSNVTSVKKEGGITKKLDNLIQELLILPFPRRRIAELALDESINYTTLAIVLGELGRVLGE